MKRIDNAQKRLSIYWQTYTGLAIITVVALLIVYATSPRHEIRTDIVAANKGSTISDISETTLPVATTALRTRSGFTPSFPVSFVENAGQTDPSARFMAKGIDKTIFFRPTSVVYSVDRRQDDLSLLTSVIRLHFVGAGEKTSIEGHRPLPGTSNFVRAHKNGAETVEAQMYGSIAYHNLYHGVDLVYTSETGRIKSEFVVRPGGEPDNIRLRYEGAKKIVLRDDGALVVITDAGEIVENRPFLYQKEDTQLLEIDGAFALIGDDEVGFTIGPHNTERALMIDPLMDLEYSTYLGGNEEDGILDMAFGSDGSLYIVGTTGSNDLPVTAGTAVQPAFAGGPGADNWGQGDRGYGDTFISRFDPTGQTLLYSTYFGGSDNDVGVGIAVDGSGNVYVAGTTLSNDFPTTPGAFQSVYPGGGPETAFVSKFGNTGALTWSTYLGTGDKEGALSLDIDADGRVYIVGATASPVFPIAGTPLQNVHAGGTAANNGDGFFAVLNETGSGLTYSTYLGGTGDDLLEGISRDSQGNISIIGMTDSNNFPQTNAVAPAGPLGGGADMIVTRLNPVAGLPQPTQYTVDFSTVFGGSGDEEGIGIAVDGSGNTYVAGWTNSNDFPTTNGAYQRVFGGGIDHFICQLPAGGNAFGYSTQIGTPGFDEGNVHGLGLSADGSVWFTGFTDDANYPITGDTPLQPAYGGGFADGIVVQVNSDGTDLVYSTYLGGAGTEVSHVLEVGPDGQVCVAGRTNSSDFPLLNAYQPVNNNIAHGDFFFGDAFITCFAAPTVDADLALTHTDNPDPVLQGATLTYSLQVTNNGPSNATNVSIIDGLPQSADFVAAPGCNRVNGTVICDVGDLAAGAQSMTYEIMVTPTTSGPILNTATVTLTENDPNPNNNTVEETTQVTPVADLAITKTDSTDPVAQGSDLTYSIVVTNNGPSEATGLIITDTLPADVTFDSASPACARSNGIVTCSFGNLAVGRQETVTIDVTTTQPGTITNEANVVANEPDLDPNNSTVTETTLVTAVSDLQVAIDDFPDPVRVGENLNLTINITNQGPADATNLDATVIIPSDVTFVSASDECRVNEGAVNCRLGVFSAYTDVQFDITVIPNATPNKSAMDKTITHTVTVTADESDPDPNNNSATTNTQVLEVADLSVTKTDSDDPAGTNSTLTYTLGVTNNGPSQATGVTLVDTLPDDVTFVSTDNQACAEDNGVVTCNVGALNSGQSVAVEVDVTTPGAAATITNSAGVSGNEIDPDDTNNAVTEDTEIVEVSVLTRIDVSPATVDLNVTQTQQFTAAGFDQFDQSFAISPSWTATGGTIDGTGLYTAGDASGSFTVTATDAGVQGTAGITILSGMAVQDENVPVDYALHQNYPNPFNARTTISFDVKENTLVRLQVFNLLGHEVRLLVDRLYAPGRYQVPFDAGWLPSGVYLYWIEMGDFKDEKTMLLLK